jgi:hypothetical protein
MSHDRRSEQASMKSSSIATVGDGSGQVLTANLPKVLPPEILPLREWEDRARLAAHITRTLFTISPRTLETWPVRSITVNKRALLSTAETLDYARGQLAYAEVSAVRRGRSSMTSR